MLLTVSHSSTAVLLPLGVVVWSLKRMALSRVENEILIFRKSLEKTMAGDPDEAVCSILLPLSLLICSFCLLSAERTNFGYFTEPEAVIAHC
jgi:hypothetical protein